MSNEDAIWTYQVQIMNDISGQVMEFEYDLDLGEEGDCGMFPEEFHDEVISQIEGWIRIVPTFVRSSLE